jgi:hypothetical protein
MATACGVIVPKHYYEAIFIPSDEFPQNNLRGYWEHTDERGYAQRFFETHAEGQFIRLIKSYRLA